MKLSIRSSLKTLLAILLITYSLTGLAQANTADSGKPAQPSKSYSGYSVDGRTSASVITAKRSHTVATEDERGLAIYSGLIVIGLIVFFVHALSKKK